MAEKKSAISGAQITNQNRDFGYKRDQAMNINFARMQEILQRNVNRGVNKTFTQYTKDLVKLYL